MGRDESRGPLASRDAAAANAWTFFRELVATPPPRLNDLYSRSTALRPESHVEVEPAATA
jgi:hypothetical protein